MQAKQKAKHGPLLRGLCIIFKMLWLAGAFKSYRPFRGAQWHTRSSMGGATSPTLAWCIMRERALASSALELFSGTAALSAAAYA